jgi:LuxR family maltose regulon positive regulatory protein
VVCDDTRARDATERADNLLRAAPDPVSEFRSTLMHGRLAMGAGDVESQVVALQAGRDLLRVEPALVQVALAELPFARQLHAWLALGQCWLGYPSEARATLDARPTLSVERTPEQVLAWGAAASIAYIEGYLDEALMYATRARDTAAAEGVTGWCTWPAAHVLAALARERASTESARRAFDALVKATQKPAGNVLSIAAHIGLAHTLRVRGDATGALDRLSRVMRDRTATTRSVTRSWIDQAVAMTYLRLGQVRAARTVLGPSRRPVETLVAALVALADGRSDEAVRLAASVPRDTPRPQLIGALIDARAAVLQDDDERAISNARVAMRVAQEHGFLRSVLDFGTALLPEFERAAVTAGDAEFVTHLRDELALSSLRSEPHRANGSTGLSDRELDVLRYLATHLSTREIAQSLHVSRNTVKSHMQHLYRKLGVGTREAAVEQARSLQLLR